MDSERDRTNLPILLSPLYLVGHVKHITCEEETFFPNLIATCLLQRFLCAYLRALISQPSYATPYSGIAFVQFNTVNSELYKTCSSDDNHRAMQ